LEVASNTRVRILGISNSISTGDAFTYSNGKEKKEGTV